VKNTLTTTNIKYRHLTIFWGVKFDLCIWCLIHACYISHPSRTPFKLCVKYYRQWSSSLRFVFILLQYSVLTRPQSMFSSQCSQTHPVYFESKIKSHNHTKHQIKLWIESFHFSAPGEKTNDCAPQICLYSRPVNYRVVASETIFSAMLFVCRLFIVDMLPSVDQYRTRKCLHIPITSR
jgi:hypothetical protein